MERLIHTPAADGYWMPGEYEPHHGTIMIWPERPGSWIYGAVGAREAFAKVIRAIAKSEEVYVATSSSGMASAMEQLGGQEHVHLFIMPTDDAWARDVAPTFVINAEKKVRAVNWEFNAWGGTFDGLYADWTKDNAFAQEVADAYGYECYDAAPFVLEGGAIHSDGEGTLMVCEACLLSKGRNPKLSKEQITQKLEEYLGIKKVLWLPRGIYQDETNEHVDNVCAFIRPGEVVLAWTENEADPQYGLSMATYQYLSDVTDAKGRRLRIHKLPIPDYPVCITKEELAGYAFEEGEDEREAGERLAASYVNFYFTNEAVLIPAFGGENEESDARAVSIMRKLCPEREMILIPARDILVGGGNIHCITQQIPKGQKA